MTDSLLAKAKHNSDGASASVTMYFRWGKKNPAAGERSEMM